MKNYLWDVFKFQSQNFNILIVEDSSSILRIIDNIFRKNEFNTFLATSLKEARQKINLHKIDYIILDINLPDGHGYELIKELSNLNTKIIVLTSQTDSQLKEVSYQKGVIDFINKDKNFIYKVSEIPNLIAQLEKNRVKTILIVDDSYVVREQLKDILENRNYNVLEASNSNEALNIINEKKIDLILLDLQLQNSNGYDFLIKNRKVILDKLRIKIVIISGNISSNTLRDCFRIGVREIIKKPYIIEELVLKTDMLINDKDIEDEVFYKNQLLNQYKNTIDKSFIVSKTDARGYITYVNEVFCKISGYTKEELLGKPHNIVRHPDMDCSIFKQMWHTIKELKQTWQGKIKNRRKDGSVYWVQAIINPILDSNEEVIEYIGIREDVTQIENSIEHLKRQYHLSQEDFEEIIHFSKQYENAMNVSNIILRVDKNQTITYANKKFYEISGFAKEELIGKHYDFIERSYPLPEDNPKIRECLISGQIWTGQVINTFKNQKTYAFKVTVVPITNLKGEIVEYLSIRKNITDVVQLHEEIEETQREIIYKMGEIGESRSNETGNHVKRVAEYSKLLAKLYGLEEAECDILFTASPMHDIGKVGIPDYILHKTAKFTSEEFEIMKTHTMVGYEILKNSKREILKAASIVARDHHEKWDGSGYPKGSKAEEIHIYGRITAVADVFDALGSDRCYKKAWSEEDIFKLLKDERAKHFDPVLIDLFFENVDKFRKIRDSYKD